MSNVLTSHSRARQTHRHAQKHTADHPSSALFTSSPLLHLTRPLIYPNPFIPQSLNNPPSPSPTSKCALQSISSCSVMTAAVAWWGFFVFKSVLCCLLKIPGWDASRLFAPGRRWRPALCSSVSVHLVLQHLVCVRPGWPHKPVLIRPLKASDTTHSIMRT